MSTEIEQLQADIAQLKADARSPYAAAIRDFEADHQRRVEAGRIYEAQQQAKEDAHIAAQKGRSWVNLTCSLKREPNDFTQDVYWSEIDLEDAQVARTVSSKSDRFGSHVEYQTVKQEAERKHRMYRLGHEIVLASELEDRIKRSAACEQAPTLADLIERGDLLVAPLSADECIARERMLYRQGKPQPIPRPSR